MSKGISAKTSVRYSLETYGASLFIQGCTILQGIILARSLGPVGRGEFAAILLWPTILAELGTLGIEVVLARWAGKRIETQLLSNSALRLSACTGCLAAIICFFSLPYLMPKEVKHLVPLAVLFTCFIPIYHSTLFLFAIDQGSGRIRLFNLCRSMLNPIYVTGLLLGWYFAEKKLHWAIASLLVAHGSMLVLRIWLRRSEFHHAKPISCLQMIKEGLPFQLSKIFSMLNQNLDQVILVWLLNPIELGYYAIARSVGSIVASLPVTLGIISFSEATRLDRSNGFSPFAEKIRMGFVLSVLLGIIAAPFVPFLIPLFYGKAFSSVVFVSYLALAGTVFAGLVLVAEESLRGHGKSLSIIFARSAGSVIIVCTGLPLSRLYGASGMAGGWFCSQIVMLFVFLCIAVEYFEDGDFKSFIPRFQDFQSAIGLISKLCNNLKGFLKVMS
ncbi:MAG: oligosaccharide flippase family protein [Desulfobulbaceae bacterium]|nr:MAG: oligosaccharide flippase family protein [Desulfobulbaceae bacterium]